VTTIGPCCRAFLAPGHTPVLWFTIFLDFGLRRARGGTGERRRRQARHARVIWRRRARGRRRAPRCRPPLPAGQAPVNHSKHRWDASEDVILWA
jgi:hypothetical protein